MKTINVKTCGSCMFLHTDEAWDSKCKIVEDITMPHNGEFNIDKGVHERCPLKKESVEVRLEPAPKPNAFLFHAINPTFGFGDGEFLFDEKHYKLVAEVFAKKWNMTDLSTKTLLEWIFEKTQNIEASWVNSDPAIKAMDQKLRSTSVGDVIIIAENGVNSVYKCDNVGWVLVPENEYSCHGCHYAEYPTGKEHVHFFSNGCDCE